MHVARILDTKGEDVFALAPEATVSEALNALAEHDIGALLVREPDGRVCGIISERDIVRTLSHEGAGCLGAQVRALMSSELVHCGPNDTIDTVMAVMTEQRVRHLPVMQDDRLLGMISIGDVVKHRMEEVQREAAAMREYISAAS